MQHPLSNGIIQTIILAVSLTSLTLPETQLQAQERSSQILAEHSKRRSHPNPTRRPRAQRRERERSRPSATKSEPSLSQSTVVRGLLGMTFGTTQSVLTYGGDLSYPIAPTAALEFGGDYWTQSTEYISISLLRIAAGASYIYAIDRQSTFRIGGRFGTAQVSVTMQPIELLGEEVGGGTTTTSLTYGEARVGVETNLGGVTLGGVFQLPLFYSQQSNSGVTGYSIYGSVGVAF